MSSRVTDWYALSKSIHTPRRLKSSFMTLMFSMESSLHAFTNPSTPNLAISSLLLMPSFFSAAFSVGRPCMSYPARSSTSKPCMRLYLRMESFNDLFQAVPMWTFPDVYGGPSRK